MKTFTLNNNDEKKGAVVPSVLLENMSKMSESCLRIALAVCALEKNITIYSINEFLSDRYTASTIEKELGKLENLGLVTSKEKKSGRKTLNVDDAPQKLSRSDAVLAASDNKELHSLIQLSQEIFGRTLSANDVTILATLALCDNISTEVLSLAVAHCSLEREKPHMRYVDRMVKGWAELGITTLEAAENHLDEQRIMLKHKTEVAELLGVGADTIKYSEMLLIHKWFIEYTYGSAIIKEAILHAGEKNNVRYINGILSRWHAQGFKTVKDVRSATTGANVQPQPKKNNKPEAADAMTINRRSVPTFKNRKE